MAKATLTGAPAPKTSTRRRSAANGNLATPDGQPPAHVMVSLRDHQAWWRTLTPLQQLDAHLDKVAKHLARYLRLAEGRWPESVVSGLRQADAGLKATAEAIKLLPPDLAPIMRRRRSGTEDIRSGMLVTLKAKHRAAYADVFDSLIWTVRTIRGNDAEVLTDKGAAFFPLARLELARPEPVPGQD